MEKSIVVRSFASLPKLEPWSSSELGWCLNYSELIQCVMNYIGSWKVGE